jgi:hypothetical protein
VENYPQFKVNSNKNEAKSVLMIFKILENVWSCH